MRRVLQEGWYFVVVQHGSAVDEENVTADAQVWCGLRQRYSFREAGRRGHQGGRSHNSTLMAFHDSAIHARGKPEVIRIDDQSPHIASVAAAAAFLASCSFTWKIVTGAARSDYCGIVYSLTR